METPSRPCGGRSAAARCGRHPGCRGVARTRGRRRARRGGAGRRASGHAARVAPGGQEDLLEGSSGSVAIRAYGSSSPAWTVARSSACRSTRSWSTARRASTSRSRSSQRARAGCRRRCRARSVRSPRGRAGPRTGVAGLLGVRCGRRTRPRPRWPGRRRAGRRGRWPGPLRWAQGRCAGRFGQGGGPVAAPASQLADRWAVSSRRVGCSKKSPSGTATPNSSSTAATIFMPLSESKP